LVVRPVDDHDLLVGLEGGEGREEALGLDLLELEAVDDDHVAVLGELRERAPERADAHLARRPVAPVARARGMRLTAADVHRRAEGPVTRAPGALLLVDLLGRPAAAAPLLRRGRALPPRGELGLHDLV